MHSYGARNCDRQTKRLKTTLHINFILVGLFGIHLLSHADMCSLYRVKILRLRLWTVFVITRIPLNQGSVPYILLKFWPG